MFRYLIRAQKLLCTRMTSITDNLEKNSSCLTSSLLKGNDNTSAMQASLHSHVIITNYRIKCCVNLFT